MIRGARKMTSRPEEKQVVKKLIREKEKSKL